MTQARKGRNSSKSTASRSKKELSFMPERLSQADIVDMGEMASRLLKEPKFTVAVRTILDDLNTQTVGSEPHEVQKREWFYHQHSAMGRILQKLVEYLQLTQSLSGSELRAEEAKIRERDADRGFATAPNDY